MKTIKHFAIAYVAALVLLTASAFTQVNFMSNGGVVTTKPDGTLLITARAASIQGIQVTGHFQVDLPNKIVSGDLQNGVAVFAAGGIFEMIISAPVPYTYTGTIAAGSTWELLEPYPDNGGDYVYTYSFHVISPQGGNVGCGFESNTLTAPFSGSLTIAQALVCNTDVTQPENKSKIQP
jgi:hypothetical protein